MCCANKWWHPRHLSPRKEEVMSYYGRWKLNKDASRKLAVLIGIRSHVTVFERALSRAIPGSIIATKDQVLACSAPRVKDPSQNVSYLPRIDWASDQETEEACTALRIRYTPILQDQVQSGGRRRVSCTRCDCNDAVINHTSVNALDDSYLCVSCLIGFHLQYVGG